VAHKRRGFGRIRQERSGRYSAAYVGPDTKLHKAPRTYSQESDAEGWLAAERRKIDLGTWGAIERSDGITLRTYSDRWIEQRNLRPSTRAHYESMLNRLILPDLGDAKMPTRLHASVVLAAWCGLRWGETAELRRKDVSKDCATLRVRRAVTYRKGQFYVGEPKTAAGVRDVAIPPHIRPIVKAHLKNHVGRDPDSLLFPTDDGRHHMHGDNYRTPWEKARAAIGKPNLRVHDLRHVGAVLAAQSGATTAELMHRLGHTTPQMALKYQHVAEGRDAEIAERLSKLAAGQGN
jgi:integrase